MRVNSHLLERSGKRTQLTGTGCLSHRQIAELLGISHGRVMQIEQAALRKLRKLMVARGLTSESVRP